VIADGRRYPVAVLDIMEVAYVRRNCPTPAALPAHA
jgi:hypothetical protein